MTNNKPEMTARKPIEIAVVSFAGAQATSIHGLTDLFGYADYFARLHTGSADPTIRVTHWQADASGTLRCCLETSADQGQPFTAVILPACQIAPPQPQLAKECVAWVREQHAGGAIIAAVCGGVFLLAESGLLAGRRATTHWMFAEELQRRFPDITVNPDLLVIDDHDLVTAGGVLAWVDMGLKLVERFLGTTVMSSTAHFMLMDPRGREQRYYGNFAPRLQHGDRVILSLQHWLQANPSVACSVSSLADRAGLGARTFLRRFTAATGVTPSEYQQRLRVARSRERLEFTRETIEQIAAALGYEDAGGFRRAFKRVLGLSPAEYRRRFHHERGAGEGGGRSSGNVHEQLVDGRRLTPWGRETVTSPAPE
jgi:transcriptional regulator GlxA family with amidase domain